ncbi:MAG TPA: AI-2E family transporter [Bacteroidales bacterium]|nr:AI-2E family transporter [Bacteroidales bacterium]
MQEIFRKYRLFFILAAILVAAFLIWFFSEIVIYLLLAGVISMIGAPVVSMFDRLRIGRFGFPRALSVAFTLILFLSLFLGMLALFIPLVANEATLISSIDGTKLLQYYSKEIAWLRANLVYFGILKRGLSLEATIKELLRKFIDFSMFSDILSSVILLAGQFFIGLFSIVFLSFFFLKDPDMLPRFILLVTPDKFEEKTRNVMSKSRQLLSRYFIGLVLQILANISTYSLALYLVGVNSPLVIGFFAGIIIIVPYIGGIIAMALGVVLGVTGVISAGEYAMVFPMIVRILAAMAVVQLIDNNVFAPLIQGHSVRAHPVEIFLVVIAAATIGGMLGMVVAVPVYGFIKIVAGEFLSHFRIVQHMAEKK